MSESNLIAASVGIFGRKRLKIQGYAEKLAWILASNYLAVKRHRKIQLRPAPNW
jgi:hypothetical protein